eukprot:scaffold12086_cov66-Cyclotella_meneghiniana.AAC.7
MPATHEEQKALLAQILTAMQGMTPPTTTPATNNPVPAPVPHNNPPVPASNANTTKPAAPPLATGSPNLQTANDTVMSNLNQRREANLQDFELQTQYFTEPDIPPPGTWIELNGNTKNIAKTVASDS